MNLRILVTGKNRRIASDICDHLEIDRRCPTIKCPPSKNALFDTVLQELPNVVIICLSDESKVSVRAFDVLKEVTKLGSVTIIIVANDADRGVFINHTDLERMFFLSRPVSLFALYEKLAELERKLEEDRNNGNLMLTEYINPRAGEKYPRKHIIVVDDDTEQLMQMKEHLKEFYEVTLAVSANNLFKYLEKYKVDLILLDYLMPEMDGPTVLTRLREFKEYKDIPVIFLTGVSEKETVVKTLVDLKPQGYVLKPAKKSEIVAKIIEVMDSLEA